MKLLQPLGAALRLVVLNPIVLLVVATLSGAIGAILLLDTPTYLRLAARAEKLQPLHAAGIADAQVGREALLEGRVSGANPALDGEFVAYVREEYRSGELSLASADDSPRWAEVVRATPPLRIALADGEARLANDDYALDTTAVTRRDAEPTLTRGAVQSRGYVVGSPVLAIGTIADASGPALRAEFVYAGTRAAYIAEMRRTAQRSWPIGGAALLICALSGAGLVRQVRRFLREVAAEQAAEEAARPAGPPARRGRPPRP